MSEGSDWEPGLKNGIPFIKATHNILDFGAVDDGVTDCAPAIRAAVDAAAVGGGAVIVPPGTYRVGASIFLANGVVLRGRGAARSHLVFDLGGSTDSAIFVAKYVRGPWVAIENGYSAGSTVLSVLPGSEFTVPGYAEVSQDNDPELMYTEPEWDQSWAEGAVGEVVQIIGRNNGQLILERPLRFDYRSDLNPKIRDVQLVENAGVEDLHLARIDSGDGYMINFDYAASVWVRGVESEFADRSHVQVETVYRCEIRESYFHHAHDYGGGGHGLGVKLTYRTTGCLVEDNIFSHLRHAMMVSVGANGNVFGYNYSREPLTESNWGYLSPDISLHGHYPYQNLFEGNIVQHIAVADYWGPAGPANTMLRNCVETEGIWLYDSSHGQLLVGNVVGGEGAINIDSSVLDTVVHGNLVSGVIQWDPTIPDTTIPTSLYLGHAPWFFADRAWPSIGADIGLDCINPARQRWLDGDTTPSITTSRIFNDSFESGGTSLWITAPGSGS
jgi:hypothetical protein